MSFVTVYWIDVFVRDKYFWEVAPSGQASVISYQGGKTDAFIHYYNYDAHGRPDQVYTSKDKTGNSKGGGWLTTDPKLLKQADYDYFLTGGLKRTELADKLQGLDYTYTIQGQLKAINSPYFKNGINVDPGKDGPETELFGITTGNGFAPDVFGMALDYYQGDYTPANVSEALSFTGPQTTEQDRFDGLIKNVSFANFHISNALNIDGYTYDGKNQLINAVGKTAGFANSTWTLANKGVSEIAAYDAQGNLDTKARLNTSTATQTNSLKYDYTDSFNKLKTVKNGSASVYSFTYDQAGRMTRRIKDGVTHNFTYDAADMVTQVRDASGVLRVAYIYDEAGQKVAKKYYSATGVLDKTEFYSYDAGGTLMAIYSKTNAEGLRLAEIPLYGMERLGMVYIDANSQSSDPYTYTYEIKDHLGSVRAIILRTKNADGSANVVNSKEYFAFGAEIASASPISAYGSRYGFQGEWAEKDRQNTQLNEFELRHYDADLGRWMVPDPYHQYHSPYLAMGNNPVNSIDPDGGLSQIFKSALFTTVGFIAGGLTAEATGGDFWTGAAIGAGVGLGASFMNVGMLASGAKAIVSVPGNISSSIKAVNAIYRGLKSGNEMSSSTKATVQSILEDIDKNMKVGQTLSGDEVGQRHPNKDFKKVGWAVKNIERTESGYRLRLKRFVSPILSVIDVDVPSEVDFKMSKHLNSKYPSVTVKSDNPNAKLKGKPFDVYIWGDNYSIGTDNNFYKIFPK